MTCLPAVALTWAMPCPIRPAPMTKTRSMLIGPLAYQRSTSDPRLSVPWRDGRGVRLAGWMEVVVDAHVNVDPLMSKPAAAAIGQARQLINLHKPKYADPKGARSRFAARRGGQLHVVDHDSSRRSAAVIGSIRCSAISSTVECHSARPSAR